MKSTTMRRGRRSRRGLTLIELMVGTFIALFLTAAAVMFASHETKLLGYSTEQVDMQQQARAAIDLLTANVQLAGIGVGYSTANVFRGLETGAYNFAGLAMNNTAGRTEVTLIAGDPATGAERGATYQLSTHDLGIRYAEVSYATVAAWTGAGGEICDDPNMDLSPNQFAVLRTEDGITAKSVFFTPAAGAPGACSFGQCPPIVDGVGSGCRAFTITDEAPAGLTFQTDASIQTVSYQGGEIATGFKFISWFVAQNAGADNNLATLRRAVFDGALACGARNTCGAEQAYNVETLQYRVWRWNANVVPPQWEVVPDGAITGIDRLRVDFELVVRNRVSDGKFHNPIRLRLSDDCVPNVAACAAPPALPPAGAGDNIPRRAHRWSVEIRNSGRMLIRST